MPGELCPLPATTAVATGAADALVPAEPRLAGLLAAQGRHARFSEDGRHFLGTRDDWSPGAVTAADLPALYAHAARVHAVLVPAERGVLLARVHALLAHYRQEALPPEVERALAEDWADDLGSFPRWAIDAACRAWRRDPKRYRFRPLPGDLRALCEEAVAEAETQRARLDVLIRRAETVAGALPGPEPSVTAGLPAADRARDVRSRVADLARQKRIAAPPR